MKDILTVRFYAGKIDVNNCPQTRQTSISLGGHFVCPSFRPSFCPTPSTFDLIGCFVVMVISTSCHVILVPPSWNSSNTSASITHENIMDRSRFQPAMTTE